MDTLTHALSGALLARALEPSHLNAQQPPRKTRMWVCAIAAAFPDSDFILRFFDPFTYLTLHRGVTHSIVLLFFWAAFLAWIFYLLYGKKYPWRSFVGLCALGIAAHIGGDLITAFGTMILAPFSYHRFAFPITFIIDLYFSGIILLGLIGSFIWKKSRLPAVLSLGVLLGYLGLQTVLYQRAIHIGEQTIAQQQWPAATAAAIPQPFSPFNWMLVITQPQQYHITYLSLSREQLPATPTPDSHWLQTTWAAYTPVDQLHWQTISRYGQTPQDIALAEQVWQLPILTSYQKFTAFPAVTTITHDETPCVWFQDLRFMMPGRKLPFQYGACQDVNGHWQFLQKNS